MTESLDLRPAAVKSVEVTVRILDCLTDSFGPVRVTDLARDLGMTKTRVSRHLQTLTLLGLVDKTPHGGGYVFGRKLLKFGRAAIYRSNIVELARPFLRVLRDRTGHTAVQTLPARSGAMVVTAVPNEFEPGVVIQPGTLLELPKSPAARLTAYFERQPVDSERVRVNLARFGVDFEADARGNGLGGIAAPIFDSDGGIAATIGLVLSSALVDPEPGADLIRHVYEVSALIQREYAEGAISPLMPMVEGTRSK
ncbi:MAG: helix-turn-helix domain-containing protein [Candidatus Sphingomonas phytovorans]|nr:helix-turn-helix domain-containing protein [Sphingomonas sp.]WEK01876.1 MAG: helix-turn-helix domain-containing protein [Sphingomonas sp.]